MHVHVQHIVSHPIYVAMMNQPINHRSLPDENKSIASEASDGLMHETLKFKKVTKVAFLKIGKNENVRLKS